MVTGYTWAFGYISLKLNQKPPKLIWCYYCEQLLLKVSGRWIWEHNASWLGILEPMFQGSSSGKISSLFSSNIMSLLNFALINIFLIQTSFECAKWHLAGWYAIVAIWYTDLLKWVTFLSRNEGGPLVQFVSLTTLVFSLIVVSCHHIWSEQEIRSTTRMHLVTCLLGEAVAAASWSIFA